MRHNESNEIAARRGRLPARPAAKIAENGRAFEVGLRSLQIEENREVLLRVPAGYNPQTPAPLALLLHGAGGNARHGIDLLENFADESGIILLAPQSFHATWDVIADGYGADVEFIDAALREVFERFNVDASRLAACGFSDGASYALSVGVTNGDLFSHAVAFSPGFMAPGGQRGAPRVFVSHGTRDAVLPIDRCSRKIVPQLRGAGYEVTYREFDGAHQIPHEIAAEAVRWFVD